MGLDNEDKYEKLFWKISRLCGNVVELEIMDENEKVECEDIF